MKKTRWWEYIVIGGWYVFVIGIFLFAIATMVLANSDSDTEFWGCFIGIVAFIVVGGFLATRNKPGG